MTVYVDDAKHPYTPEHAPGRSYVMCHLWADTVEELLAFVDKIEVNRRWIQGHPTLSMPKYRKASWVHFDIVQTKRVLAVKLGAVETDKYGPIEHVARLKGDHAKLEQIARCRALPG